MLAFSVALGQVVTSDDKDVNLRKGVALIRRACKKEADLLILPELFMAYREFAAPVASFVETAESLSGPFVRTMARAAKDSGIHVAFGMIESSKRLGLVYNTVAMLGPDGSLLGHHRKVQLFDSFGYKESSRFAPGSELEKPFRTSIARVGMMTCYELRFPEIARLLALEGAEVLVVPTAWVSGRLKEDHLHVLARARALENTVFVAVACQTGRIFTGRSIIVDPFGVPLCDAGEEEGLIVTEIDLGRIARVRRVLPSLHARRDVYTSLTRARKL